MTMSRPRASGPQQLPAAVVVLAVSIALLAAVLVRMENGRERRSKHPQQQPSNDTTHVSAVTDEIGCRSSRVHTSPAALGEREILADGATATAATPEVGEQARRAPVQARSSCAGGGAIYGGGCRCCAQQAEQAATAPAPAPAAPAQAAAVAWDMMGAPLPRPAQAGALFSLPDAPERGKAGTAAVEAAGKAAASDGRRLELLVHNVSHKDMVLSLRRTRLGARPRFYGEPGYPIDAVRARPPSSSRLLYIDHLTHHRRLPLLASYPI